MKQLLLVIIGIIPVMLSGQSLCENGFAAGYACQNTHLLSNVTTSELNGGSPAGLNDIWGWTDPISGREFALVGMTTGTSFVEITDALNPVVIGKLPTHTNNSTWRDIKVYNNYAFIGSEAPGHGMQIFDLNQLLNPAPGYQTFTNSAHYSGFGDSHNIVINEESGYAYAVGADFSGGLHVIDISNPLSPSLAGGFSDDGYTHDAQVVNYIGPDSDHAEKEIAFACNTNTLTIVDVSDKTDMQDISITTYPGQRYTHQGWLTEDHQYFLMDDELDELQLGVKTTTFIWDVRDLDNPQMIGTFVSSLSSIDHNQYIQGDWSFQSNYSAGLRVLNIDQIANAELDEVAFFDTYPANNNTNFNGTWSNYPFFQSRNVIVSDGSNGLFIVRPVLTEIKEISNPCPTLDIDLSIKVRRGFEGPINIGLANVPSGLSTSLTTTSIVENDVAILTLGNTAALSPGDYTFDVLLSDGIITHKEEVNVNIPDVLPAPMNLSTAINGNTLTLQWDPVPNSIACKARGRVVGTNGYTNTPIFYGFELSSYDVSLNALTPGQEYEWQVICGCSVSPIVASPWSAFDFFTTTPLVDGDGDTDVDLNFKQTEALVYPNPTNGMLNIRFEDYRDIDQAEIISPYGNVLMQYNQLGKNSLKIDIAHLSKGIYFARLSDGKQTYTKKVLLE